MGAVWSYLIESYLATSANKPQVLSRFDSHVAESRLVHESQLHHLFPTMPHLATVKGGRENSLINI